MKPYEFTGVVEHLGAAETFASGFTKRLVVLADDPAKKFPHRVAVEFVKDRVSKLDILTEGATAKVSFYPDARWWESKDGGRGRWLVSMRGWDADLVKVAPLDSREPLPVPDVPPAGDAMAQGEGASPAGDMPF